VVVDRCAPSTTWGRGSPSCTTTTPASDSTRAGRCATARRPVLPRSRTRHPDLGSDHLARRVAATTGGASSVYGCWRSLCAVADGRLGVTTEVAAGLRGALVCAEAGARGRRFRRRLTSITGGAHPSAGTLTLSELLAARRDADGSGVEFEDGGHSVAVFESLQRRGPACRAACPAWCERRATPPSTRWLGVPHRTTARCCSSRPSTGGWGYPGDWPTATNRPMSVPGEVREE
jgi:hypothetical protein